MVRFFFVHAQCNAGHDRAMVALEVTGNSRPGTELLLRTSWTITLAREAGFIGDTILEGGMTGVDARIQNRNGIAAPIETILCVL